MTNPTYPVSITYYPPKTNGVTSVSISGVTYSVPTQSAEYYEASMLYVGISATGSDYRSALNNLLIIATASTTPSPGVMPFKPTW